jgi:SAM-dependent methyltransferase
LKPYSDYDEFAWLYNRYWGAPFSRLIFPIVNRLLLSHLPERARVLDLCCGTGQFAALLSARGFRVTGLDGSRQMLRYARWNAPAAELVLADARSFTLPAVYEGVVSVFDSLNHIMDLEELKAVFHNVRRSLRKNGMFLFDVNMPGAFRSRDLDVSAIVRADHACIVRRHYFALQRIVRWYLTMFRLEQGSWKRRDLLISERIYRDQEIRSALAGAGFRRISVYDAGKDLRMTGGQGRSIFVARCG